MIILIVDDHPTNQKLMRAQLEAEGHAVLEAANGIEALAMLDREHVDAVISDILMPGMDGYRLCYEVRRHEDWKTLPFIFYTSTYTSEGDQKLGLDLGADAYLGKPSPAEAIVETLNRVIAIADRSPVRIEMPEDEALKQYSERLVSKLEEKNIELEATEKQLRATLREVGDLKAALDEHAIVAMTDPQGRITFVNDKFCAISQYSRDELIGQDHRIINPDHHSTEFIRDFWRRIGQGKVWHGEIKNEARDGSFYWLATTIVPFLDQKGKPRQYLAIHADVTERKRAEEELRATQSHLRQVLEHSPAVLYESNLEGGKIIPYLITENISGLLGFTLAETLSPDWWLSQLHPEDREHAMASIPETLAHGVSRTEYRLRHKDGSFRWVDDQRRVIRDSLGQPMEFVGVWTDVTERRLARDAAMASERRFREMLENVALLAVTLDTKGTITFCNDYLLKTTGWSREEVMGTDWFSKFIPGNPEVKTLFFDTIEAGKFPTHYENPIKTREGKLRDILWNNTVLRDAAGAIVGTASIGKDATDRKRAEARVCEQAAMLDRANEAIIVCDIHTWRITFWNHGAERLYGWTAVEAEGINIGELIFADPSLPATLTGQLLKTGEWHGEHEWVSKAGRKRTVSSHMTLVCDGGGNPKSALVINIDITEQKALEARFLRAQRLESIGTLASGVAHDLNNILSPIMMSVPMLRRKLTAKQFEDIITTVEMSAARGAEIVRQVLTFGRGLEGQRRPLKVDALITELMKIMGETFPKNIAIESSLDPNLWRVLGDATQIHQVLLNLCVNARDAMPDGGRLRLSVANLEMDASYAAMLPEATPGPHVLLEVSDTGTGIPPEIVERIFDPFFTTKGVGQGTGLGLSTTHGIVKSHGGFIHVNTQPGKGTTFQVYLPASPDQEAAPADASQAAVPEGHGELVLVVDDEANVRGSARIALETSGYRVLVAADGTEALAVFAMNSGSVAAVLTDLMMPFMDGVTLVRALRKMAPILPIIASTGLGEKTQFAELKAMGVETILGKPYGADTLERAIHAALHPSASARGRKDGLFECRE